MTIFEKITTSPSALATVLETVQAADSPWDRAFREMFCANCEREDCDGPGGCPHQEKRGSPAWWLGLNCKEAP